jgi:hypothetical protein
VARPHKKAGRAIQVTSTLPAEQLAAICKDAADQSKLRLDQANPGQLVFSVRGAISSKIHLMTIEVRLASSDGAQVMTSRILRYKTNQSTFLLIPTGPKRMMALSVYEKFMQRFAELSRHADPQATVAITE